MIPLAAVLARKKFEERKSKEIIDKSPHPSRPFVGLRRRKVATPSAGSAADVGSLQPPVSAYVDVIVNKDITTFKFMLVHELSTDQGAAKPNADSIQHEDGELSQLNTRFGTYDFYFPVSECGKIVDINVEFNGTTLRSDTLRVSKRDGHFISSSTQRKEFLEGSADEASEGSKKPTLPKKKLPPTLFYYRVPFVMEQYFSEIQQASAKVEKDDATSKLKQQRRNVDQLSKAARMKLDIYIEVKVKTIMKAPREHYRVLLPLLCLPIPPNTLRCEMEMPRLVRRVWTPCQRYHLYPYLNNEKADFSLVFTEEKPLYLEEYLFVIDIELGDPIVAECVDPVSLLVMVTAFGMMLFFMLTKDLQDFE